MRHYSPLRVVLFAVLLCCCASAHAQQQGEKPVALPAFEFHSGFWINLHHFLYLQGRLRNAQAPSGTVEDEAPQPEFEASGAVNGLTADQQKAWSAAVNAYAKDWSSRDLLRNSEMTIINNRLAELENCADLSGKPGTACAAGLKPDLVAALDEAAPVYRAHWWPQQDIENRAWIEGVAPLVRRFGADLGARLMNAYQRRWPPGAMRVDVVWYAGPLGSYTSLEPIHLNISSHDQRNQGLAALEMLYHEASHMLAENVSDAIVAECRRRGVPIPRDLWHALVYYTTGELVRRVLATAPAQDGSSALTGYTPYANRNGLYDRGWSNYQVVLERYWQAYLDGQIPFDTAISRMIASL
jgi:hypothetical protein